MHRALWKLFVTLHCTQRPSSSCSNNLLDANIRTKDARPKMKTNHVRRVILRIPAREKREKVVAKRVQKMTYATRTEKHLDS